MKAKELIEILLQNPEDEISLSVSDANTHFFCDRIIEVTNQRGTTYIVADISEFLEV